MSVPIEFDRRYKVNIKIINEMIILRKHGLSYNEISKKLNVGNFCVYYWINKDFRLRKRKLNAIRKYKKNDVRIKQLTKRRNELKNLKPVSLSCKLFSRTHKSKICFDLPYSFKGIRRGESSSLSE